MNIIPCHILKKEKVAKDVMIITIKAEAFFEYQAGQYALLSFEGTKDAILKAYSIGNKPHTPFLEFHFKDSHTAEGFSHRIIHEKNVGDVIYVHGIQGNMTLKPESVRPLLFIAGGVGVAPFKAIFDSFPDFMPPVDFFWGCNTQGDLYLQGPFAKCLVSSHFCLADEAKEGFFHGLVSNAVLAEIKDVSNHDVYLAGPPSMVEHCVHLLKDHGLSKNNLFCDYKIDF